MEVLEAVIGVFNAIAEWIGTGMESLVPIFWNATEKTLTYFGVLSVAGLAFSVIFLLLGLVAGFMRFRSV